MKNFEGKKNLSFKKSQISKAQGQLQFGKAGIKIPQYNDFTIKVFP